MPDTSGVLKTTPLHETHVALGAKTAPFARYDMPIMYTGITEEHLAVRQACGVFDVSHMGRLFFHGNDGLHFLQTLTTVDVPSLAVGHARYGFILTDEGGVLDDVILYARADSEWLLVVNASNRLAVLDHMGALGACANVRDDTESTGMVAVQGPATRDLLDRLMPDTSVPELANRVVNARWQGVWLTISTTGYTGEDGVEIVAPASEIVRVWDALCGVGAVPIGLGARDTLRLEMGYPLHGHELAPEHTPWQAGLGWAVDTKNTAFHGRAALMERKHNVPTQLIALRSTDRGIPRRGYGVEHEGENVGSVTSGTYSPTLISGIALAFVTGEVPGIGSQFVVYSPTSPQRKAKMDRVALPFYTSGTRRGSRGTT